MGQGHVRGHDDRRVRNPSRRVGDRPSGGPTLATLGQSGTLTAEVVNEEFALAAPRIRPVCRWRDGLNMRRPISQRPEVEGRSACAAGYSEAGSTGARLGGGLLKRSGSRPDAE